MINLYFKKYRSISIKSIFNNKRYNIKYRNSSNKKISIIAHSSLKNEYINEGVTEKSLYEMFDSLLDRYVVKYNVGDRATGEVVSMDNKFIYVDMGIKDHALLPREEVSFNNERAEDVLSIGSSYEFLVIRASKREHQLTISLKALEVEEAWKRSREQLKSGTILEVSVISSTKGGYRVEMKGHTSFLPISQIHPKYLAGDIIGRKIPVILVDVDKSKNRSVCSNRKALTEDENSTSTLADLNVGDIVKGFVQNITTFGVFIDLNGIVGLLHVSQISNDRVNTTEGIFHIGEPIKCMVLALDEDKGRLSLSTKKLEPTPGDMIRNRELVMERAEEMAKMFRERVAAAEAALKASEEKKVH